MPVDTMAMESQDSPDKSSGVLKFVNLSGIAAMQLKKPVFPLTVFEKLTNVSESDDVVFGGEGIGR